MISKHVGDGYTIYKVQDNDRPMFVVADSWMMALQGWREFIRKENDYGPGDPDPDPTGIMKVCDSDDLIIQEQKGVAQNP